MQPIQARRVFPNLVLAGCAAALIVLCGVAASGDEPVQALPDGPGKEVTARVCSSCHGIEVATSHRDTKDGWNAIVSDMVQRGAKGTDDEFGQIVDYLAEHFPKAAPAKPAE